MNQLIGAKAYAETGAHSKIASASGHELIDVLLRSILERLTQTSTAMSSGNVAEKGRLIGKMLDTLMYLQVCLDQDKGELSRNLNQTYDTCMVLLTKANLDNQPEYLDRVAMMISAVRDAWIQVGEQTR